MPLNITYAKSIPGVLRILTVVLAFICCFTAGIWCYHGNCYSTVGASSLGFVLFVLPVSLILSFMWLLMYLLAVDERLSSLPLKLVELIYDGIMALMMFISFCIMCNLANNTFYWINQWYSQSIVDVLILLVLMICYILSAGLNLRSHNPFVRRSQAPSEPA